jgi:hypothetical protein
MERTRLDTLHRGRSWRPVGTRMWPSYVDEPDQKLEWQEETDGFCFFFFFYYFIIHLCIQGLGHFSWQFSKAGKRHKPPDTQCPHRPRCFVVKPQHGWGWRESENQTSKATEKQWAQSSRWLAAWNSSMGPRERSQHPRILYPAKLSLRSDVKWMFLAPLPRTIPEKSPK